jgi:hypothetical protein
MAACRSDADRRRRRSRSDILGEDRYGPSTQPKDQIVVHAGRLGLIFTNSLTCPQDPFQQSPRRALAAVMRRLSYSRPSNDGAQGRNRTLAYPTESPSFFEWRLSNVPTSGPGAFFAVGRVRLCAAIPKSCACLPPHNGIRDGAALPSTGALGPRTRTNPYPPALGECQPVACATRL